MITTKTILGTTVYGTPSGNYDGSSQDWASDAQQAANYYRGRGSAQTIAITVTGFVGEIILEATLDSETTDAVWFETDRFGDLVNPVTDYHPVNIPGNFVWMRARVVGFDAGTINSITISY